CCNHWRLLRLRRLACSCSCGACCIYRNHRSYHNRRICCNHWRLLRLRRLAC
ncbi:hypothetical protein GLOIN_2v1587640, partial [Rhizophagus irregularis DAOM 181602=DAOM 197198]